MWIAAIDPGKKNFAFVIEEIDPEKFKKLDKTKKNWLSKATNLGNVVKMINVDLTHDCKSNKYLDPKVFVNITDMLDEFKEYWAKCSVILIELQMSFGKRHNTMAIKIAQHCYSYFSILYRDFKQIIEFPAYHKTQVLCAPKKMDKPQRKKWAIQQAQMILNNRCDEETLDLLLARKKQDDMSDCMLMCICYSIITYCK